MSFIEAGYNIFLERPMLFPISELPSSQEERTALDFDALYEEGSVNASQIGYEEIQENSLAEGSVTSSKLDLTWGENNHQQHTAITATSSPGQSFVNHVLPIGTYLIYGMARCYVDAVGDVTGGILWTINDGSIVLKPGPSFYFSEATGWQNAKGAGFFYVITLTAETTIHLSAYKGGNQADVCVGGGGTRLGYVKIK